MNREPLAERMRPQTLDDVIGQSHLLASGEILRQIVKNKEPVSLILWGPPGTGKTYLAIALAFTAIALMLRLATRLAKQRGLQKPVEGFEQSGSGHVSGHAAIVTAGVRRRQVRDQPSAPGASFILRVKKR